MPCPWSRCAHRLRHASRNALSTVQGKSVSIRGVSSEHCATGTLAKILARQVLSMTSMGVQGGVRLHAPSDLTPARVAKKRMDGSAVADPKQHTNPVAGLCRCYRLVASQQRRFPRRRFLDKARIRS